MKTQLMAATVVAMLGLVSVAALAADDVDVTRLPGYVNLSEIKLPAGGEITQEIDLGPALLKAAFSPAEGGAQNPAIAQALDMVKSVRLITFSIAGEAVAAAREQVDRIEKQLAKDAWKRVIMTRDQNEYVVVSALHGPNYIQGLMVMAVEEGEATFVNVVGELNFGALAQLAGEFESQDMKAMLEGLEEGEEESGDK